MPGHIYLYGTEGRLLGLMPIGELDGIREYQMGIGEHVEWVIYREGDVAKLTEEELGALVGPARYGVTNSAQIAIDGSVLDR